MSTEIRHVEMPWGDSQPGFQPSQVLHRLMSGGRLVRFPDGSSDWPQLVDKAVKDQGASIELRLGDEYYITDMDLPRYLSETEDTLVIPGGQFALLTTREKVELPTDGLALISLKSKTKLKGLVNVSGFHVDPGFEGRIHYGVFNAGPTDIVLRRNQPLFLMFVIRMHAHTEHPYHGTERDKLDTELVSTLKGRPVTLDSLDRELEKLKVQVQILIGLSATLVVAVIGLIAKVASS
jgi:dCTP deaminase